MTGLGLMAILVTLSASHVTAQTQPRPCGLPASVANASVAVISPAGSNTIYAVYTCNSSAGFALVGQDRRSCTNGVWSTQKVLCQNVVCSALPPNMTSGSHDYDRKFRQLGIVPFYTQFVSYTCTSGFVFPKGVSQAISTCTASGNWSLLNTTCQVIDCGSPLISGFDCNFTTTTHQSRARCSCKPGYTRALPIIEITCQVNGSWTGPLDGSNSQCNRVSCGEPAEMVNSVRRVSSLLYGDTAQYVCHTGFEIASARGVFGSNSTCQRDGTWSRVDACVEKDCGSPPEILNGQALYNSTKFQHYATYHCSDEWVLLSDAAILCTGDGVWSPAPTCTQPSCSEEPPLMNYGFSDFLTKFATTTCSDEERCNYNNWWGRYDCYTENVCSPTLPHYSQFVTYTCDYGYHLSSGQSSTKSTCQASGRWSQPQEPCTGVECGPPPSYAGLSCDISSTVHPSTIHCFCDAGYERSPTDFTRQCQADRFWSAPLDNNVEYCSRVSCGDPPIVENSLVKLRQSGGSLYNDSVTDVCILGYEFLNGVDTMRCQADRSWSKTPVCILKDCGKPPQILNGLLSSKETTFNSIATYACNLGYNIVGNPAIKCTEDGSWQKAPFCYGIRCGEPPVVENSNRLVFGFYFLDVVAYSCLDGFVLRGNTNSTCQFDGFWSAPPTCQRISCGPPPRVEHGAIQSLGDLLFGNTINYECFTSYQLIGAAHVTCLPSGQWTQPPNCTLKN